MIRQITHNDIDKLYKPNNINDYLDDPYNVGFCNENCEKYILVNFNPFFNYWKIDSLNFQVSTKKDIRLFFSILKYIAEYAENRGFYQFFLYLKVKDYINYNRIFNKQLEKYELAIDELVKAYDRPVATVYWQWLFNGELKNHDLIVVHHFLRSAHRPKIKELLECL